MTQRLPNIQLQSGIQATANVPLFVAGYIIGNESGLSCTVEMQGLFNPKNLHPGMADYFPCAPNFSGNIIINNTTTLTNIASWPSSYLTVDMVLLTDKVDASLYPMPLPTRQTTTPTTSGNPIFSATVGFGSTVGNKQVLNVFNPQNSGVNYEFHSARVFTSGNQLGIASSLQFNSGPDNLYSAPVTIASHSCSSSQPVSTANATSQEITTTPATTVIEVIDTQQNVTLDFLLFPDKVTLAPGNNLTLIYGFGVSVTPGTVVRITLKWTEVPLTATPTGGGSPTPGNILTAANIVNTTNPADTGIISAYPNGDGTPAIFADNAGNLVLGSSLRDADLQLVSATLGGTIFHIQASTNTILFDGAQPFPGDGFTFHSEDGTNQLHVVDSGATFSKQAVLSAGAKFPVGSISQINTFTVAVTTTPTAHAHGLTVAPTGFAYIFTGTGTTAGSLQVSSIGATNITLTASGSFTAIVTVYAI